MNDKDDLATVKQGDTVYTYTPSHNLIGRKMTVLRVTATRIVADLPGGDGRSAYAFNRATGKQVKTTAHEYPSSRDILISANHPAHARKALNIQRRAAVQGLTDQIGEFDTRWAYDSTESALKQARALRAAADAAITALTALTDAPTEDPA